MTDRHAIAARLRALLDGTRLDAALIAAQLGVPELALRLSTDELAPDPAFEVMIAAIRHFALDPRWLVTGDYSTASHLQAVSAHEDGRDADLRALLSELMTERLTWPAQPSTGENGFAPDQLPEGEPPSASA